ncbi:hypothetical protein ABH925_003629 [Streptacidiphilus sp. EB129]
MASTYGLLIARQLGIKATEIADLDSPAAGAQ